MVFDNILQLQRQLTDKYVVVDAARPELKRFTGMTGVVKTVNFSGRALVQFDANNNIGWFDIDPQFLKVIDAPLPKPAAKEPKAEKKAAPVKTDKPAAAKPIGETPAKPAAGSVADILAAARGGAKPAAKAEAKPAAAPKTTAEILAAARSKPEAEASGATPAKVDPTKMSVADMLAAARGQKPAAPSAPAAAAPAAKSAPAAKPAEPTAVPAKVDPTKLSVADMLAMARGQKPAGAAAPAAPVAKAVPPPEPVAEEPTEAPEPAAPEAPAGEPVKVDRTKMDVAAMLAYCRKVDGKG